MQTTETTNRDTKDQMEDAIIDLVETLPKVIMLSYYKYIDNGNKGIHEINSF